ncbi:MAG TPA: phosphate acyltransferase, partial [Planctomycetota bacterium]|nr:phosphate acyltransferase [Planctomycetota bacterium]
MTDPPVLQRLRDRARARRARIVLPETGDPRTVEARALLEQNGWAQVVWVPEPSRDPRFEQVAAHIHDRRRQKGVDLERARALAQDPLYFAAGLVALGHADGSVGGALHPTAHVIRAGLQVLGTVATVPLVSSMFLMLRGELALSFADCGVVPDPDQEQLGHIALATAHNHQLLTGQPPKVAFLSFSSRGSATHGKVDKVRMAAERFQAAHPEIAADGELQFDAAFVPAVAARKCPDSPLHGQAN